MEQPETRRKRGRPSAEDGEILNESACLETALAAFAERGFEGASIREIARQLGVSHGLLNVRFGSKHSLWRAAVDHGMERLLACMSRINDDSAAATDIPGQMRRACVNFLLGMAEQPAILQVMNNEGTRPSDRLDHVVETFFRSRAWPFATLLRKGQESGIFRPVNIIVPFTMLAHGAGAIVALRPFMAAVDAGWSTAPGSIRRAAEDAADILVHGLMAKGAASASQDQ